MLDLSDGLASAGVVILLAGLWLAYGVGTALIGLGLGLLFVAWCHTAS